MIEMEEIIFQNESELMIMKKERRTNKKTRKRMSFIKGLHKKEVIHLSIRKILEKLNILQWYCMQNTNRAY